MNKESRSSSFLEKAKLNFFLHNARSGRNKTNKLSAIFEKPLIHIGLCVEFWISNTSDDNLSLYNVVHADLIYIMPKTQ